MAPAAEIVVVEEVQRRDETLDDFGDGQAAHVDATGVVDLRGATPDRRIERAHIRSGAETPSSDKPLATTVRVASTSKSRAECNGAASSSPLGNTTQAS